MSTRDAVLLLTHSGDSFTIDRVADGVRRRGARAVRVDTDRFPAHLALSSRRGPTTRATLTLDGERIADDQVRAVWYRRVRPPLPDPDLDPSFAAECAAESLAALDGWFDSLEHARWIDRPAHIRAAGNKLRQLRLAAAAGLRVPDTVVSNDPGEVRALYDRAGGRMIAKLLRALSTSMDASGRAVYTSAVAADDLDQLASLASCPMVFQARIDSACELRVAYVAGRCFTGGLVPPPGAEPDWRRAGVDTSWRREHLDDTTAAAARRLMERLGLSFGALDLIRTPAGETVFLEVNPIGEWGMLERALDLPVGDAIADALVTPT